MADGGQPPAQGDREAHLAWLRRERADFEAHASQWGEAQSGADFAVGSDAYNVMPEEEPPVVCRVFHGLRESPYAGFPPPQVSPSCVMLVLAKMIAPASRSATG